MIALTGQGSGTTLSIATLPVWQGVQARPGIRASQPFSLGFAGPGPIRQTTAPEIVAAVLDGYADESYTFLTKPPGSSAWADSLGDSKIEAVLRHCGGKRPGSILEIGAGSAYVAERLIARFDGPAYTIVDPAVRAAPHPVRLVRDYFPAADLAGERFDLIIGFNCLEHVPDPVAVLRAAGRCLAPGGAVLMSYPDVESGLADGDLNILMHEHLTYFTEQSSRWAAAAAGLSVAALERQDGGIVAVLEPAVPPPPADLVEEPLIRRAGGSLQALLDGCGSAIRACLDGGGAIGFHGATNGLNSFLALTGLGDHPAIRVYDGDDSKVGMFLPACAAPILPSRDPSYPANDRVYVSAVTFLPAITRFAAQCHRLAPERLRPLTA